MKPSVHILVTCHDPILLAQALLVFKSVRIGFPTADINIYGNALSQKYQDELFKVLPENSTYKNIEETFHPHWIERLVMTEMNPFWICDTDMIFYKSVEDFNITTDIAGRLQPAYYEPWTKSFSVERIHTCLMRLDPCHIRGSLMTWCRERLPEALVKTTIPFIAINFIPINGRLMLYDTCAGLYNICTKTIFDDAQNEAFAHLHSGTHINEVSEQCEEFAGLFDLHKAVISNPELGKLLKKQQDNFYESHKTI
jgi:hypothetical protein